MFRKVLKAAAAALAIFCAVCVVGIIGAIDGGAALSSAAPGAVGLTIIGAAAVGLARLF